MSRGIKAALAIALCLVLLAAGGFALYSTRTVEVRAGRIVECVYGHVISDDVKSIRVPPRAASEYSVSRETTVCPQHRRAEALYREAQEALAAGDIKTARARLAEVVDIDRDLLRAAVQLSELDNGGSPKPDSSAKPSKGNTGKVTPKPDTPGDDTPGGPVVSLMEWTPDELEGYVAEPAVADVFSVSRQYVPESAGKIIVLTIAAEQVLSEAEAERRVGEEMKPRFPKQGVTLKVGGRSAWAGHNGRGIAIVAIVDGPSLVVLEASSESEDSASALAEVIEVAEGLRK